jgi:hypothetical protein
MDKCGYRGYTMRNRMKDSSVNIEEQLAEVRAAHAALVAQVAEQSAMLNDLRITRTQRAIRLMRTKRRLVVATLVCFVGHTPLTRRSAAHVHGRHGSRRSRGECEPDLPRRNFCARRRHHWLAQEFHECAGAARQRQVGRVQWAGTCRCGVGVEWADNPQPQWRGGWRRFTGACGEGRDVFQGWSRLRARGSRMRFRGMNIDFVLPIRRRCLQVTHDNSYGVLGAQNTGRELDEFNAAGERWTSIETNGINGTPRTANETRPSNMAVVWIMRVK